MGYSEAGVKLIDEKNQQQKILWHCPFNVRYWSRTVVLDILFLWILPICCLHISTYYRKINMQHAANMSLNRCSCKHIKIAKFYRRCGELAFLGLWKKAMFHQYIYWCRNHSGHSGCSGHSGHSGFLVITAFRNSVPSCQVIPGFQLAGHSRHRR